MAQVKVTVLGSEIGLLIQRRLARDGIDKSAELRRLAELGYACERAGFILDGTVLRHGGRAWHDQPDLVPTTQDSPPVSSVRTYSGKRSASQVVDGNDSLAPAYAGPVPVASEPLPVVTVSSDPSKAGRDNPNATVASSSLASRLRGLSGT